MYAEIKYKSNSQRARVLTESWLLNHMLCPACNRALVQTKNNTKAHDFVCSSCCDLFELKSKKSKFTNHVVDGAYETMIKAIRANQQPNLFLLSYRIPFVVTDVSVLPKRFLVEPMVIKRKPLSPTAQRAGWVGCNLSLKLIPKSALIPCMIDGALVPPKLIQQNWKKTAPLDNLNSKSRGWATVTLGIVERLPSPQFSLQEVYQHEADLANMYPSNRNIKAKLRQQLQVLRDLGLITFLGNSQYRIR